jgi:GDPmannose 4,6-dehydratase
MTRTALITGITGQDGRYLTDLLTTKDYTIHGTVRPGRESAVPPELEERASIRAVDLTAEGAIDRLLQDVQPDEIYNLAAISSLEESDSDPDGTQRVNAGVPIQILTSIERFGAQRETRFCQASSSQIFGRPDGTPRDENTAICPENAYATAKARAQETIAVARQERGIFGGSAILFNHESPRRSSRFVSRKISEGVVQIAAGRASELHLWNLDSSRDWGFAGDYVRAMWLMLQQDEADDFVIATGTTHSVGDFVEAAFAAVGIEDWTRFVVSENADAETGSPGDPTKARTILGWTPEVSFQALVSMMVERDKDLLNRAGRRSHS